MPYQALLALIRHGLTWLGGWMLARGFFPDEATAALFTDEAMTLIGAGITLIGLAWSLWRKRTQGAKDLAQEVKDAEERK
jgi:hypothetical protein